ncbi:hypothetical protein [Thermoproteus tenax]|uniref:Uncharacterized protein n=1 Tax=Thermoproteus tenax (strain ATCC 35583 / DSM 2078 / JCM 9277 / NBRC 100435 / Kra 1) TaxID=768679 RepID=G4RM85_THETK|nr:hypothetical protein [Thermoproteus tenax]CCC82680.1 conserved hypothetical protein [Thermoproteus tenax Kra 1]
MQIKVGDKLYEVKSVADLEKLCSELRGALEDGCIYNSWYIRVPPERLLEILSAAYTSYLRGDVDVASVVGRYLEERGLNKSLTRTITPTLSALGLSSGGVFSKQALEVGRLLYSGRRSEAAAVLREISLRNCIIREIIEKLGESCDKLGEVVETTLRSYGKTLRADEVKYTGEFVRVIHPPCTPCNFSCIDKNGLPSCYNALIERTLYSVIDLFERLDIALLPMHLAYVRAGDKIFHVLVRETGKLVGLIVLSEPVEGTSISKLRDVSKSLDSAAAEGEYEFILKIIPILEGSPPCLKAKAFVEVIRSDLERASRIVKLD